MSVVEAEFADSRQLGVPSHIIESPWVVLKFGGSSVASYSNWQTIADIVRNRMDAGLRVLVVHSALAGVSDLLSQLLEETESGGGEQSFDAIIALHRGLAGQMGLDADEVLGEQFSELEQLAAGSRLVKEVSPRVHARIMALGELMATRLSGSWLQSQKIDAQWLDARSLLQSRRARHSNERQSYLNAVCDPADSDALRDQLQPYGKLILTQGFIAANQENETVLLGRGGSDTSAAYFASMLGARRLEIWSDVPGVFSADPKLVPGARLLKNLHYDEAQEIASTGGSVLHPRSIAPMRRRSIPVFLRCTGSPELSGTVISPATPDEIPQVKAVSVQKGITLLSLEGIAMWQEAGFLADVFQTFARHGVSVDLVSTSESNVTVSIEENLGEISSVAMELLVAELSELCRVRVLRQCSAISLVGRRIRTILHKIGPALQVFEEERVYLVSQAANDLNLSFVCDEDNSYRIVERLHALLFKSARNHPGFGMSWEEFSSDRSGQAAAKSSWWRTTQNSLLEAFAERQSAFVYNLNEVEAAANRLLSMQSVANVFYAMKANPNPEILRVLHSAGANFECVSPGELKRIFDLFPDIDPDRLLFTPNFAARDEYRFGFECGVRLTLDNLYPLQHWPELFKGRDCFVRLDPGHGRGHHEHVKTAGSHAKFGVPLFELDSLQELASAAECSIVGIHAHSGSGILDPANWEQVAVTLSEAAQRFPDVRVLDLGGGLGVPERPGDKALDIASLDRRLGELKKTLPGYDLWLEPGRYLVAEAGVLLARVTQTKGKRGMRYLGVATGMNSLIRPALYGAFHEIVNLTRLGDAATETVTVVGPICESADKLGTDRLLPVSVEGDVILVANAGAYGRAMASNYNLREPAEELALRLS